MNDLPAQALARKFHETYERLAPQFGYETRKDTRELDLSTPNGLLMTAVCAEMLNVLFPENDGRPPLPDPKTPKGDLYYADMLWASIAAIVKTDDPAYAPQAGVKVITNLASTQRVSGEEFAELKRTAPSPEIIDQEMVDRISCEIMAERSMDTIRAHLNPGEELLGTQTTVLNYVNITPKRDSDATLPFGLEEKVIPND